MNRERTEARMTDREALAAALELLYEPNPDEQGRNTTPVRYPLDVIGAAARERLAQLPETCGTCDGGRLRYCVTDDVWVALIADHLGCRWANCPTCHGSGKVYPAELVERAKAALRSVWPVDPAWWPEDRHAVAVLDALNGETE